MSSKDKPQPLAGRIEIAQTAHYKRRVERITEQLMAGDIKSIVADIVEAVRRVKLHGPEPDTIYVVKTQAKGKDY